MQRLGLFIIILCVLTQCLATVTIMFVLFNHSPVGQPQARSTPLQKSLSSPSESAALLRNGKPLKQQEHRNGVKNGAALLRAASSTSSSSSAHHKNPKKLQSNPSINSQSSKRSKGSSKSNSSQIPTEAQDGGWSLHFLSQHLA